MGGKKKRAVKKYSFIDNLLADRGDPFSISI